MSNNYRINYNKQELADIFGVETTTIDIWVRKNCPVISKGSKGVAWKLNTADVYQWRKNRAIEQQYDNKTTVTGDAKELEIKTKQEKYRLIKYQADEQKTKAELAEKKVINVEDVESVMSNLFTLIRSRLLNVPDRIETEILNESNINILNEKITAEIKAAMYEICEGALETIANMTEGDNET